MPEMRFAMIAVVFLAIFGPLGIAHAGPIRVGELTCASSPRVGLIIASRQILRCVFRSRTPALHLVYSGSTRGLDFDIGRSTRRGAVLGRLCAKHAVLVGARCEEITKPRTEVWCRALVWEQTC